MQHIEIREVEGVPAVVTVSTPAPTETDASLVENLMSDDDLTQYEEIGNQVAGYSPNKKLRSRTVLVVDDDADALEEMIDTLKDYELCVISAKDAEETFSLT